MRKIIIATKNEKKLRELKRYLKNIRAKIISLKDFEKTPRIVENADTFRKNAIKKAQPISRFVKGVVLADDSGLVIDALGGMPGVKSSRFAGLNKNDRKNNIKVLKLMKKTPLKKRQAAFICAIAIADRGRIVKTIEESCKGLIAFYAKGGYGFGYDPLFLIPKYGKTFGELGLKVKDRMSHRAKALKKARKFLRSYFALQR